MTVNKEVGELKAKVSLDTLQFNDGVKKLSSEFQRIEREFKIASAGLDKVSDASKITALNFDKLTKQTEVQRKIVEQFRQAHQKAAEQFGESSKKAQDYEIKLKRSEAQLIGLEKQLRTTTESMNRHGISASEAAKRFKELGVSWESVGRKFTEIGRVMTAAITAPILAAGALGMKFNAQMEDFQANFETMLGSADAAQSMIADLTNFAKSTPFEMTGLADSAKILLNFGVDARDVMQNLQMLGDVSLGNQEKLGRITLAFGQIQSTGRLMGQDLLQLVNAGFNPLQVISEKTGQSMASLKEDMEKGAISSKMVTEAFRIATSEGGTFFKAMDKGSKTFNGQMSTLKDTINITLGETMKPIFDDLSKNVFPKLIASVEELGRYFASLSEEQALSVIKWAAIAAAAGPVLLVVGSLITSIPALIAGVKALGITFAFLTGHPVILGLAAIAAGIGYLAYTAGEADRAVQSMTRSLIANYQAEAEAAKTAIDFSHKARIDSLNEASIAEDVAYEQRMTNIQDEYDAHVKSISGREQALRKSLQERGRILDDNYKKAIERIQDEYGVFETKEKSKTEIVQENAEEQRDIVKSVLDLSKDIATQEGEAFAKTYDAILKKASEIHDEKLRMYQEEYLKSVMLINQDLAKKVGGFQAEIDAITQKTKEEEQILKDQADADKIRELQAKVDTAKSFSEYTSATKALADEINRQNRAKELTNRQIQIDSLNKQIETATKKANEEKQNALVTLQTKTGEQQIVIDKATANEITAIQKVRLAKEAAETKKYNAAKSAIEKEEAALDGWSERYKLALDEQLKAKQKLEKLKYDATVAGLKAQLNAEQQKITAEKQQVDRTFEAQKITAQIDASVAKINELKNKSWISGSVWDYAKDQMAIKNLEVQIEELKKYARAEGIPGFASGVVNWRGGLARVNEKGGEIQYLKQGTTVIPNDISQQMARSVGASNSMAETNALLRELLNRTGNSQIVLDNRVVGEAIMPSIFNAASRQGKAWPVRT